MKSGTAQLMKFKRLARRLNLPQYAARGVLEALWEFARVNTPAGDVGRFENADIAEEVGWDRDADDLILGLVEEHWLDAHETHRLVIHDWSQHCEDTVHRRLARAGQRFADGTTPSFHRLSRDERAAIEGRFATQEVPRAQRAHAGRTTCAPPRQGKARHGKVSGSSESSSVPESGAETVPETRALVLTSSTPAVRKRDLFGELYEAYPKHQGEDAARKAWNQIRPKPTAETLAQMLRTLTWQRLQPDWIKDGGQYIPAPGKWLREGRWKDEPVDLPRMSATTAHNIAVAEEWLREEQR
jgi:hypothetical protein